MAGVLAAAWLGAADAPAWVWVERGDGPAAETDLRGAMLEADEENDWFAGTDRHYTQGARVAYLDAEAPAAPAGFLGRPLLGLRPAAVRWGGEVGQLIFTPEDLAARQPLANDRPYAGWLYAGAVLQRRGTTFGKLPALESIRLQVGIVGPDSLTEAQQEGAHFVGGFQKAYGWSNQLPNEPGLALKVQRACRLASWQGAAGDADIIPHAGFSLGNVDTSFRAGTQVRLGWRLPADFGYRNIEALGMADGGRSVTEGRRLRGLYLFGGVEGRAVLYNEFLDGAVFRDSLSVDRRPFVVEWQAGLVVQYNQWDVAFAYVLRSAEFIGQGQWDTFGSVSVRWCY